MEANEMRRRAEQCRVFARTAADPTATKHWTDAADERDLLAKVIDAVNARAARLAASERGDRDQTLQ
jgi:hypothetical protein